jgi:uncharacterized RDD family membrane protein YckC
LITATRGTTDGAAPISPTPDTTTYVYYDRMDYGGFFRRLAATGIDLALLGLVLAVAFFTGERCSLARWWLFVYAGLAYSYLVLLKRSRFRTMGYLATGLRIVNLKGQPPGILLLSLRLLWWVFGPLNAFIDFVYMTGDKDRQTIRDKMMQTYVIKKNAKPTGTGSRCAVYLNFMGLALTVWEVSRPAR